MWNASPSGNPPDYNHADFSGLQVIENRAFERHNLDVHESPVLPMGSITPTPGPGSCGCPSSSGATRGTGHNYATPPATYSHLSHSHPISPEYHTLSRKSTFSTLPEVAPTSTNSLPLPPSPPHHHHHHPHYDTVSPIVFHPKGGDGSSMSPGSSPVRPWASPDPSSSAGDRTVPSGLEDSEKERGAPQAPPSVPEGAGIRGQAWLSFGGRRDENNADGTLTRTGGGAGQEADARRPGRICGMRRKRFFALFVLLLVAIVALGVGLGVGLSRKGSSSGSTSSPAEESPTTPDPSDADDDSAWPSPTTIVDADGLRCPQANRTEYRAGEYNGNVTSKFGVGSGPGTGYLFLCGYDYARGGNDLASNPADTAAECFDQCANTGGCVGAGWGFYDEKNTCWLKGELGEPFEMLGWHFAVARWWIDSVQDGA